MRLLLLSDLHLENRPCWRIPESLPPFDVAVFAGDIAETPRAAVEAFIAAPALSGRQVVYVPGNHELFSGDIDARIADGKAAAHGTNVTLLDRDAVVAGGARFIGAILWTDYDLKGDVARAMAAAEAGMYEHRLIRDGGGTFTPSRALDRHREDLAFIEAELAKPFDGPTVVVTHHAPDPRSVHEKYAQSLLSAAFASDLRPPRPLDTRAYTCLVGLSGRRDEDRLQSKGQRSEDERQHSGQRGLQGAVHRRNLMPYRGSAPIGRNWLFLSRRVLVFCFQAFGLRRGSSLQLS